MVGESVIRSLFTFVALPCFCASGSKPNVEDRVEEQKVVVYVWGGPRGTPVNQHHD